MLAAYRVLAAVARLCGLHGAGPLYEPAHLAASCELAAVACLRGLLGAELLCEPAHVSCLRCARRG